MKRIGNILLLCILLSSCTIKLEEGVRLQSSCWLHIYPDLIIKLEKDSFEYDLAYVDKPVTGTWKIIRDTLFLSSDEFITDNEFVKKKYTTFNSNSDAFLIRGKKLFGIDSTGMHNSDCFLFKIKKNIQY